MYFVGILKRFQSGNAARRQKQGEHAPARLLAKFRVAFLSPEGEFTRRNDCQRFIPNK